MKGTVFRKGVYLCKRGIPLRQVHLHGNLCEGKCFQEKGGVLLQEECSLAMGSFIWKFTWKEKWFFFGGGGGGVCVCVGGSLMMGLLTWKFTWREKFSEKVMYCYKRGVPWQWVHWHGHLYEGKWRTVTRGVFLAVGYMKGKVFGGGGGVLDNAFTYMLIYMKGKVSEKGVYWYKRSVPWW